MQYPAATTKGWSLLRHRVQHWVGGAGVVLVGLVAAAILFALLRRHRGRIAAWISDWLPESISLYEAWLVAVSLVAIGLLGKITEDVVTRESTPFDDAVSQWITSIQLPGIHTFMTFSNTLGSGWAVGATLIAIVWRWYRKDREAAAILIGLALVTQIIDAAFKTTVHRIRPEPLHAYTKLYLASFPSGHAMNAVATYGFIAMLIARERPRLRHLLFIAVIVISLLVGLARVYLDLHWPTDVLGGYCVGLLLLSIAVFWLDRLEPQESPIT